jgi:hypothetical protein
LQRTASTLTLEDKDDDEDGVVKLLKKNSADLNSNDIGDLDTAVVGLHRTGMRWW